MEPAPPDGGLIGSIPKETRTQRAEVLAGRLSLRANFSWMAASRALYSACQWGMLAVLAKLTDAETVGAFTLALAGGEPVDECLKWGVAAASAAVQTEATRLCDPAITEKNRQACTVTAI